MKYTKMTAQDYVTSMYILRNRNFYDMIDENSKITCIRCNCDHGSKTNKIYTKQEWIDHLEKNYFGKVKDVKMVFCRIESNLYLGNEKEADLSQFPTFEGDRSHIYTADKAVLLTRQTGLSQEGEEGTHTIRDAITFKMRDGKVTSLQHNYSIESYVE